MSRKNSVFFHHAHHRVTKRKNKKEGSSEWARRVKERHEEDKKDNFADNIYANKIFQNDSLNWRVSRAITKYR